MSKAKLHYAWVVIFTGLLVTIGAHGFGRMSYALILPAMKDGLHLDYAKLAPPGLGFITLFFGIGQALEPGVGGLWADATQSFTIPFLLATAVSFMGMLLSLRLKKTTQT